MKDLQQAIQARKNQIFSDENKNTPDGYWLIQNGIKWSAGKWVMVLKHQSKADYSVKDYKEVAL